jgi:hypothetical protein
MGTSSSYSGPSDKNPLLPSWLDDQSGSGGGSTPPLGDELLAGPSATSGETPQPAIPATPPLGDRYQLRSARSHINHAARTGDVGSLRKAVSSYVSSGIGGSKSATKRMVVASRTASQVFGFVQNIHSQGFDEAARSVGLDDLVGKPIGYACEKLIETFCPPGGGIDEALVRRAWDHSLLEAIDNGITDFSTLTADQWTALLENFIARSIEGRILADIGEHTITEALSVEQVDQLQHDLQSLVFGAVSGSIGTILGKKKNLSEIEIRAIIETVYAQAFAYLEVVGLED